MKVTSQVAFSNGARTRQAEAALW